MRDYREKTVSGFVSNGTQLAPCPVTVRMTADDYGQTLSLQSPGYQIGIPMEAVADIIKLVSQKK